MKTITQTQYEQLVGLKTLADSLNNQLKLLITAAKEITEEDCELIFGHTDDLIYDDDMTVDELLRRLKIKVKK